MTPVTGGDESATELRRYSTLLLRLFDEDGGEGLGRRRGVQHAIEGLEENSKLDGSVSLNQQKTAMLFPASDVGDLVFGDFEQTAGLDPICKSRHRLFEET
jgi:hypothetical protein